LSLISEIRYNVCDRFHNQDDFLLEVFLKQTIRLLSVLATLLLLGALSACGGPSSMEPTMTAEVTRGPRLTPTATQSQPTEEASSASQQDGDGVEQAAADEACLTCHADAELLQTLAVEEEPTESLSSGEG
jgi:hypothetical protein